MNLGKLLILVIAIFAVFFSCKKAEKTYPKSDMETISEKLSYYRNILNSGNIRGAAFYDTLIIYEQLVTDSVVKFKKTDERSVVGVQMSEPPK